MRNSTLSWVAGLFACAPMLVVAQPVEATRPTAPLKYSSAFADYKPFQDLEPGNWRALNDAVGAAALKHGGSASPSASPSGSPPSTAAPKAGMPMHDMKSMPGMAHPMQGGKP